MDSFPVCFNSKTAVDLSAKVPSLKVHKVPSVLNVCVKLLPLHDKFPELGAFTRQLKVLFIGMRTFRKLDESSNEKSCAFLIL